MRPFCPEQITLAVLAGGEGSRMGMPKGLLRIGGRPILEHLLDALPWPGPTMLVTAPGREHPPGWQRFGLEAVDPVAGAGPLRGVLTALEHAQTGWVAILTVDMPTIRLQQLERLGQDLTPDTLGRMFRRRTKDGQVLVEPFPLLAHRSAAINIRDRLARGEGSVVRLLGEPGFSALDSPRDWPDAIWANLNRPEDLPG